MPGRPRTDRVKRELRKCHKHGLTDFAEKIVGIGQSLVHYCMECDNERVKKYQAEIKAGTRVPRVSSVKAMVARKLCPDCNNEMPISGVCDFC